MMTAGPPYQWCLWRRARSRLIEQILLAILPRRYAGPRTPTYVWADREPTAKHSVRFEDDARVSLELPWRSLRTIAEIVARAISRGC